MKRYSVGAIGMMEADDDTPDLVVWVKAEVARAMYEALKFYEDEAISSHPAEFVNTEVAIECARKVRAAIAKAEGAR